MSTFRHLVALCLAMVLTACGTLSREAFTERDLTSLAPQGLSGLRFNASDSAAAMAMAQGIGPAPRGHSQFAVLAISGGGANGAYGAGVLAGWTARGQRPTFQLVTGVSTGALIAPFAFLGPHWDQALRDAYTNGAASHIVRRSWSAMFSLPGLYRPDALRALVEANTSLAMLNEIAAENRKGRRLLVATTNLDTQETVIWDMGAIAQQGDAKALKLFQDVLVASASIPGAFPPTLIQVDGPGRGLSEMHADGGVTIPFFVAPEALSLWTAPKNGQASSSHVYVIVNGKTGTAFGFTKGSSLAIVARSFDAGAKAQVRTQLAISAAAAQRNGAAFAYTAIPAEVDANSLNFKVDNMRRLYELGYRRALTGLAWTTAAGPTPVAPDMPPKTSPGISGAASIGPLPPGMD
jgi:hypothetical protein